MPRGKLHVVVALVAAVAALLGPAVPAGAGTDGTASADQGGRHMDVQVGYEGRYLPGGRLPIRVSLRADQLLRGRIEVTMRDQTGTFSTPVEVPGGSEKQVLVVVPTPATFPIRDITVRFLVGDTSMTGQATISPLDDHQLVGLLPDVTPPDLPGALTIPMDGSTAHFVALDSATVATPGALDPIGTVVAGTDELRRLDASARSQLLDWVEHGGRLVLDAVPGSAVDGLPDTWQPDATGRAAAGLGEVRLVAGAATAQRWADVVEPAPTATQADLGQFGFGVPIAQFEGTGDAVARDAGLQALEVPWLLGFLAAYVVLVGPVSWFLLRRRRRALGWVVIPVVAIAFTGASFVVGTDLRAGTRAAHGSVLEEGAAGNRLTTIIGTVSRSGADGVTHFPAGWTGSSVDSSPFSPLPTAPPDIDVVADSTQTQASIQLAAGGFGVIRGTGPTDDVPEGRLTVEARSEDGAVVGTVHNGLPFDLERVGVFIGRAAVQIGTVAAGGDEDFRLSGNELRNNNAFNPPETTVWPGETGSNGQPVFDSVVNLGVWNDFVQTSGINGRPRGVVEVVGWTRSFTPAIDVVGQSQPSGRSAIVARGAVAAGDGVANGAARRELVRGPDQIELPDEDTQLRVVGALWQFALPAGSTVGPLELDIPDYIARVDVWDGTQWVVVDDETAERAANQFGGFDPSQLRHHDLPPGTGAAGVVWIRGWMSTDNGGFDGMGLEVVSQEQP